MSPITTNSLILRSVEVFRKGFVPFSTLALIFYAPVVVLRLALAANDPDLAETAATGPPILLIASMLMIPIASAAVVYGVFQGLHGRPATLGQCISVAASRWPAILGLAILSGLAVGLGVLMCIVPGIVLACGLYIASPALIVERLDPIAAMKRSWELTDGHKQILFSLALAIFLLQLIAGMLLNLAFGVEAPGAETVVDGFGLYQILEDLVIVLFIALNAVAAAVAYHELRSFHEGLDEDQLVAAFDS